MGLFTPGWMNNDSVKALDAVGKLTNQSELTKAAKNAPDWRVRIKALGKLTDQVVLIDIAKKDKDRDVQKAAVRRITDERVLADIAKNEENWEVCKEAVKGLTTESILIDVARNAYSSYAKRAAVEKLTDQVALLDFANNNSDNNVRFAAATKLKDEQSAQKVYAEIARNKKDLYIRKEAVEKLIDQALLLDLAKSDRDIREEAIKKLGPESLKSLMLFCCDADTSDPEKERANTALQKDITEALSNKLPTGFSKVFTNFDEYKKVSEKFKYREERVSLGCSIGSTMSKKYGFDFPPFEG